MRSLALALVVLALGIVMPDNRALAETVHLGLPLEPANPAFNLGFKALADQIPEVVGQPLEGEHYGANGDSLQQTTKGLMVWRKSDNWTAFTNGSTTWIDGPFGLQNRDNSSRLAWEAPAGSSPADQSEITLRDRRALPVAYLAPAEENTIYLWTGEPVAYLYEDQLYGFNGRHLGWFQEGMIWDFDGTAVGFTPQVQFVSQQAEPSKGPKLPRPPRAEREAPLSQPVLIVGVYTRLLSALLRMGQ